MASTCELCGLISKLNGNPDALSDKMPKTLTDEIIRLLSCGSCLDLTANDVSYDETTVGIKMDSICNTIGSLRSKVIAQEQRVPTSAEVVSAIQTMTPDQIAAVNAKLKRK